jgi:hypothetical protein
MTVETITQEDRITALAGQFSEAQLRAQLDRALHSQGEDTSRGQGNARNNSYKGESPYAKIESARTQYEAQRASHPGRTAYNQPFHRDLGDGDL